jgi:hypothetical protein
MSNVALSGNASGTGTFTIASPNSNTDRTLNLPDASGGVVLDSATQTLTNKTIQGGAITSGTAVASTSGTSIDFTGIPSWVRRITVMFNGVSTNGSSNLLIQIGAGSVTTTGYSSGAATVDGSVSNSTYTSGFGVRCGTAANVLNGTMFLANVSGNVWASSHTLVGGTATPQTYCGAGGISLGGTLDRVRITTVNGTDTFDAGSINIMYEG